MDEGTLRDLLGAVRDGVVHPDEAVAELRRLPFADLGFARVDHHRRLRSSLGEVVYAPGKTAEQCVAIVGELLAGSGDGPVLVSRADDHQAAALLAAHPGGNRQGATISWRPTPPRPDSPGAFPSGADSPSPSSPGRTPSGPAPCSPSGRLQRGGPDRGQHEAGDEGGQWRGAPEGHVVIATAGTADGPVAAECAAVLAAHGVAARRLDDVGVAGLHRLLADVALLQTARAVVVVAGMEGALPSVVGGLTGAPLVAVPTSTGYGAALDGVTALLSMLASCAAGVTVVGIDNGFGAAAAVLRMLDADRTAV